MPPVYFDMGGRPGLGSGVAGKAIDYFGDMRKMDATERMATEEDVRLRENSVRDDATARYKSDLLHGAELSRQKNALEGVRTQYSALRDQNAKQLEARKFESIQQHYARNLEADVNAAGVQRKWTQQDLAAKLATFNKAGERLDNVMTTIADHGDSPATNSALNSLLQTVNKDSDGTLLANMFSNVDPKDLDLSTVKLGAIEGTNENVFSVRKKNGDWIHKTENGALVADDDVNITTASGSQAGLVLGTLLQPLVTERLGFMENFGVATTAYRQEQRTAAENAATTSSPATTNQHPVQQGAAPVDTAPPAAPPPVDPAGQVGASGYKQSTEDLAGDVAAVSLDPNALSVEDELTASTQFAKAMMEDRQTILDDTVPGMPDNPRPGITTEGPQEKVEHAYDPAVFLTGEDNLPYRNPQDLVTSLRGANTPDDMAAEGNSNWPYPADPSLLQRGKEWVAGKLEDGREYRAAQQQAAQQQAAQQQAAQQQAAQQQAAQQQAVDPAIAEEPPLAPGLSAALNYTEDERKGLRGGRHLQRAIDIESNRKNTYAHNIPTQEEINAVEHTAYANSPYKGDAGNLLASDNVLQNMVHARRQKEAGNAGAAALANRGLLASLDQDQAGQQVQHQRWKENEAFKKAHGTKAADGSRTPYTGSDTVKQAVEHAITPAVSKVVDSGFGARDRVYVDQIRKQVKKRGYDLDSDADIRKLVTAWYTNSEQTSKRLAAAVGQADTNVSNWPEKAQQEMIRKAIYEISSKPGWVTTAINAIRRTPPISFFGGNGPNLRGQPVKTAAAINDEGKYGNANEGDTFIQPHTNEDSIKGKPAPEPGLRGEQLNKE